MSTAVREQIHAALATAIAAGVPTATVMRNADAPVTVKRGDLVLILVDGDQEPTAEPAGMNKRLYTLRPAIEGYVGVAAAADIGPALTALYAAALHAVFADRTLGGLCYDLTDGTLVVEPFRPGSAPGGQFALELEATFATATSDPTVLG